MSTLKVDQIQGSTGTTVTIPSGTTIVNSGTATNFGLAATHEGITKAYGYAQQRTSTVELKDSYNISSWTDDGTGRSTWNINNDMANTTYTVVGSHSYDSTSGSSVIGSDELWVTGAGVYKQDTFQNDAMSYSVPSGRWYDNDFVYSVVHGDLA
tara:strand:+ start:201 stop:662 length:462 start_codon:yes stop_codon:yes gene_type:complete